MRNYKVALIIGSLRQDSFNRKLANALVKLAPSNFTFTDIIISDLPLYDQDQDDHPPAQVINLKSAIKTADAVLFVTPEYNRSIPGVLKNAIDHASRPYGQSVWKGKPAGVIGVSVGTIGTALAQQHLRNVLAYLDMPTLGQPEVFLQMSDKLLDQNGNFTADSKSYLQAWMDAYINWVQKHVV